MRTICLMLSLLMPAIAAAQPAKAKYHRGRKPLPPAVAAAMHAEAAKRHDSRVKYLPKATPATYDLRSLNRTGPIQDQGQCGSCWDVSACGVATDAFIAAGQFSSTDASLTLSPQYILDQCNGIQNGGCNGDDAPTVLDACRSIGIPTTADYGPYTASPGQCRYKSQKLYKIADWGFCTPSQQQGVAATQDIKNCLVQYGTISTAVAADSSWDSVGADGVIPYENSNQIDHDVAIVGWDDGKQIPGAPKPGAWLVKNQWGTGWGANGYCWLAYGSHSIGTEAAWATAGQLPPPPTPPTPPTPPGPTPGAPVLVSIVATFSDGSTQTLGGSGGLTPDQLRGMTIQQLNDYINSAGKRKPCAPCPQKAAPAAPAPAPAPANRRVSPSSPGVSTLPPGRRPAVGERVSPPTSAPTPGREKVYRRLLRRMD